MNEEIGKHPYCFNLTQKIDQALFFALMAGTLLIGIVLGAYMNTLIR